MNRTEWADFIAACVFGYSFCASVACSEGFDVDDGMEYVGGFVRKEGKSEIGRGGERVTSMEEWKEDRDIGWGWAEE